MKRIIGRRKRKKRMMIFACFIMFILLVILIISSFNIIKWELENKATDKQINTINNNVTITHKVDTDIVEIILQEGDIPAGNPYWDYIGMSLLQVDFKNLKEINKDTKGWISINGTNVNYPFVQGNDNNYYLTHSFDKSRNNAGWVYLDYRNNVNELDKNTIIYAHGRQDNTMFGSIRKILSNGWLKNDDNFVIKMSTEYENTLWQVFSVYRIPTTSDYLQISFYDEDEFLDFTKMLINRSGYNFKTEVYGNDKMLTLSTCYNDYDKIVMHAKLIKKESR